MRHAFLPSNKNELQTRVKHTVLPSRQVSHGSTAIKCLTAVPAAVHRFKEGFVGRCEEERCSEECQNHNPAHPCERKHGGENTAARVIPACGEVAPVCPRVRGIPSVLEIEGEESECVTGRSRDAYSGNAGTNNPEEEEDEESNNLTPEEVDVAVFQPRVNRAGSRKRVRLGRPRGTVVQ